MIRGRVHRPGPPRGFLVLLGKLGPGVLVGGVGGCRVVLRHLCLPSMVSAPSRGG
ncbi:hypothetical protein STRAU_5091 [Streptomyces aurantiacus JA 4570]|uniref:Uncharacterized protein n=1 Tax=Streptomyces aurantiacus JA 4570 TaxID=1286094 RepID=S3ZGN8_9ACTN|nr:hypothetical protein STRAU_5091 [Streptomyces aurantiacus JA 4570]